MDVSHKIFADLQSLMSSDNRKNLKLLIAILGIDFSVDNTTFNQSNYIYIYIYMCGCVCVCVCVCVSMCVCVCVCVYERQTKKQAEIDK